MHRKAISSVQTQVVQDLRITYNYSTGNLTSRWDKQKLRKEFFDYDDLDRLIEAEVVQTTPTGVPLYTDAPPITYTYDGTVGSSTKGNLVQRGDIGKYGTNAYHRINKATGPDFPFPYNDPPLAISPGPQTIAYTSYHQPASLSETIGGTSYLLEYTYDADQQRNYSKLRNMTAQSTVEERWYEHGLETQRLNGNPSTDRKILYVQGGDGLCAMVVAETGVPQKVYAVYRPDLVTGLVARVEIAKAARLSLRRNSLSYGDERKASKAFAATAISGRSREAVAGSGRGDHLGGIVAVTKHTFSPELLGSGNSGPPEIIAEQNFDAWGRRRNPTTWTYAGLPVLPSWLYRGYTGHEHLEPFALINMNGRLYDPLNGRLLSADNYVQGALGTQGYNRYSYAGNNPLKYTDPSGEFIVLAPVLLGMAYGALIGAGVAAAVYTSTVAVTGQKWDSSNFAKTVALGALGGAIGGGIGSLGTQLGSLGQSLGYNVLSNVASNSASQLAFGQEVSFGNVVGMIAGGVLGAGIGNFSGVSGGVNKNIGAEIGFGIGKGAIVGGTGGSIGAAIDGGDIGEGFLNGAKYGAISGGTVAGLNITSMGAAYNPSRTYGDFGRHGPVYRRGTFLTRAISGEGTGVALGRNLITHQLDETAIYNGVDDSAKFNHFLRAHETGHYQQQINMGFGYFYARTSYEYFIQPGFINVYLTPGTLEYGADQYARYILGYGY